MTTTYKLPGGDNIVLHAGGPKVIPSTWDKTQAHDRGDGTYWVFQAGEWRVATEDGLQECCCGGGTPCPSIWNNNGYEYDYMSNNDPPYDFAWMVKLEINSGYNYGTPDTEFFCNTGNNYSGPMRYLTNSDNGWWVEYGNPFAGFRASEVIVGNYGKIIHGSYYGDQTSGSTPCEPNGQKYWASGTFVATSQLTNADVGQGLTYTGTGPGKGYLLSGNLKNDSGQYASVQHGATSCCGNPANGVWSEVTPQTNPRTWRATFKNVHFSWRVGTKTTYAETVLDYKENLNIENGDGRYYRVTWMPPGINFSLYNDYSELLPENQAWWGYVNEADLSQGLLLYWKIPIPDTDPVEYDEGCLNVKAKADLGDVWMPASGRWLYFDRWIYE
jgi:hypothetical protein